MSDDAQHPGPAPAHHRHRALAALDRVAFSIFGPPPREASPKPTVHRHDNLESEIDEQLESITVETDEYGHHYGLQKVEPKPVRPDPGVIYPYYSGRPPLNAPEV